MQVACVQRGAYRIGLPMGSVRSVPVLECKSECFSADDLRRREPEMVGLKKRKKGRYTVNIKFN